MTSPGPAGPTLGEVVAELGPAAVEVLTGGAGLGRVPGELVLHGAGEPLTPVDGGLLLLAGALPPGGPVADVVAGVAAAGYDALALKALGADLTGLRDAAAAAGLAVLRVADGMDWRHLENLLLLARADPGGDTPARYAEIGLGDLFALADTIADAVGGAVAVEDPHGRMLAYSHHPRHEIDEVRRLGILGRRTPHYSTTAQSYHRATRAERAVPVPAGEPGVADRIVAPVRSGPVAGCWAWSG
ncbi:hypothetical protein [Pseudonocardia sp. HH130630-07]|uniref:hypothetical protein n=1 Tax=Pseudonocardia sp. HH130630-07 TaxID=1690815 RepID=UPI0008151AC0|nr:hypothetical protein [Pseudonocardia sp. HH130630-07]ANY07187.1 hypothetical protein AFB00_13850 [Pseudonocardia sp. HH130630-07]